MKRFLKRIARPLTGRIRPRVFFWARQATDSRFEYLEQQYSSLARDLVGLQRYVPAVLNAIQSQNAMNRANVRSEEEIARLVRTVLESCQALRYELIEHGRGPREPAQEPKVLRAERVEAARTHGPLRLAVGMPGHHPGYLAVDSVLSDGTDVVADPRRLGFEPASVAEIRSDHLLERFSTGELSDVLLPHWLGQLEPGGAMVDTVEDFDLVARRYVSGDLSLEEVHDLLLGDAEAGSPRANVFTRASVGDLLGRAGFEEIEIRRPDPEGAGTTVEVTARKPRGATAS